MRTLVLAAAIIIPGVAVAADDIFGQYGYKVEPKVAANSCVVQMDLDQKEFLEKIPDLQKIGLVNPDLDSTNINTKPYSLSLAFSMEMASVVTKNVYDNNAAADKCAFTQTISAFDDYGNSEKTEVMTYGFSRALFKKINWDNFDAAKLAKIAPRFRFNPAIMVKVMREREE